MANSAQEFFQESALHGDCVSLLRELQNADGGWGFHGGRASRVEPTAWAMRALSGISGGTWESAYSRARDFLHAAQLSDGSWPAFPQMTTGAWVTSHACAVLAGDAASASRVSAGLQWICEDFPRDSSPFQRFMKRVFSGSQPATHDDSLRGWGWTPRTASWVEPTAFALLVLRATGPQPLPPNAAQRREMAVALLYDRMCPGGGWNCGNPRVYGVDGDALILPTCWALLALRDGAEQAGRTASLRWLEQNYPDMESAGSMAVARMTLQNYGIEAPQARRRLEEFGAQDLAAEGIHVLAWVCLALNATRSFAPVSEGAQ